MVTRAYIENIRDTARFWLPYNRITAEAALTAVLQDGLPDWDPTSDALLSRAIPLLVDVLRVQTEVSHEQLKRGLAAFAEGRDLDAIFLGPPTVIRTTGESDLDYLERGLNSLLGLSIGSLPSIEQCARLALSTIVEVVAVTALNRQDVALYALKADQTLLVAAEVTQVVEYVNHRDRVIAGVQITAPEPTIIPYRIRVQARYDPMRETGAALSAAIRTAIYAYLERVQELGASIYRSAIVDAAYVPGVQTVSVAEPAYDLAGPSLILTPAAGDVSGHSAKVEARVAPVEGHPIDSVTVTDGGDDYTAVPTVTATGGGGAGAVLTAVLTGGRVTGVTVTDGGDDYTAPPELEFVRGAGDTTGAGAAATAVVPVWTGPIIAADVVDGGGDYTAAPDLSILPGTQGMGATFTVALGSGVNAGTVASVTVDTGGSHWRGGLQYDHCPLYLCPATEDDVIVEVVAI